MKFTFFQVLLMLIILVCGCTSERVITDAAHSDISVDTANRVSWRGQPVDPDDLPGILRDAGYSKKDTITIHMDANQKDMRMCYYVMRTLVQTGFSRPILVKDRRAYSHTVEKKPKGANKRYGR